MMKDIILEKYQVRKSNPEKTAFIEYMKGRLAVAGYDAEKDIHVEEKGKGLFKSRNIVVGNPEEAEVLISAHYDTCAVLPFPNFMAPTNVALFACSQVVLTILIVLMAFLFALLMAVITGGRADGGLLFLIFLYALLFHMLFGYRNKHTANDNTSGVITITKILESIPAEQRRKVCAIYFDNEEKGLLGSDFFAKKHKNVAKTKLLLNFDCVGDGRHVTFIGKKDAREDEMYQRLLQLAGEQSVNQDVEVLAKKMKPMMFGSDQMHFKKGVGVCALRKSPVGMYVARIHTPMDNRCREENVEFLARVVCGLVDIL